MHAELGRSVRLVVDACRDRLALDYDALDTLCSTLEAGVTHPPTTFAFYYDAVTALLEEDEARAARFLDALAQQQPLSSTQEVGALDNGSRGQCYRERMTAEMSTGLSLHTPDPDTTRNFIDCYRAAMDLLRQTARPLADEIQSIVHDVIAVTGGPDDEGEFHGGSHYQLWGALFLNAQLHNTRIAMAEVLAHESAHSLLFGFCTHEPLTLNEDSEHYPSPLRSDLRPMDGIYHATFVSARMHWAMNQLLQSPLISEQERDQAQAAVARDREHFEAGYFVVAQHGKLTTLGDSLMKNARHYMDVVAHP